MDKFDRFQQLHRTLKSRRLPVSLTTLSDELECSSDTVKRLISSMRDYLSAPIEYCRKSRGYYYSEETSFELPGLWMTSEELKSLVVITQILEALEEGLLAKEFSVFEKQIENLLQARGISTSVLAKKIKWIPLEKNFTKAEIFSKVSEALLSELRVSISYTSYNREKTRRTISPIHLIYYRENWYLDAWCHLRQELRSFMLSRIENVVIENQRVKVISEKNLGQHYASSYGIFSGSPQHLARLAFSGQVAHEVSSHQWHPDEKGEWVGQRYILEVPYNMDNELVRDVLKYGRHVEVLQPSNLRNRIRDEVSYLNKLYE